MKKWRMDRLKGKVALVSGAAAGIGAAIARAFVSEGAWVAVTDIADERGREFASIIAKHVEVERSACAQVTLEPGLELWQCFRRKAQFHGTFAHRCLVGEAHAIRRQDASQGMDSYLRAMDTLSRQVGKMSRRCQHAEGWRRHLSLGFCAPDADPLRKAAGDGDALPLRAANGWARLN